MIWKTKKSAKTAAIATSAEYAERCKIVKATRDGKFVGWCHVLKTNKEI